MYKILVLFLFILFSFNLYGCGDKSNVKVDNLIEVYEGELKQVLVPIENLEATHFLTYDTETVYLSSLVLNLDNYTDTNVRVYGQLENLNLQDVSYALMHVSSIDQLSSVVKETELSVYKNTNLGLEFQYDPQRINLVEEESSLVFSLNNSPIIKLKLIIESGELDLLFYTKQNFANFKFTNHSLGNFSYMKNSDSSVYFIKNEGSFYEVQVSNLDEWLIILDSLFISKPLKLEEVKTEVLIEEDLTETLSHNQNIDSQIEVITNPYSELIEKFLKNFAPNISNFKSPISISFTDNSYFYFTFYSTEAENQKQMHLYKENANGSFELIGSFVPGSLTTWKLVSGSNPVSDRPQTLIDLEGSVSTPLKLLEGYRYLQSLPLGFGVQYPKAWYYSRVDDRYEFRLELDESSEKVVTVELVKDSFDIASGNVIASNLKFYNNGTSIVYSFDLDKYYLRILGSSKYADFLKNIANSAIKLN